MVDHNEHDMIQMKADKLFELAKSASLNPAVSSKTLIIDFRYYDGSPHSGPEKLSCADVLKLTNSELREIIMAQDKPVAVEYMRKQNLHPVDLDQIQVHEDSKRRVLGGALQKIRQYLESDAKAEANDANDQKTDSTSAFRCSRCGKAPLSGPVLYCDGCSQYMCYSCGIPSGDMIWNCPNCAIEVQRVVL